MRWRDAMTPVPMARVAVVAAKWQARPVLVAVADSGLVELDRLVSPADLPISDAARRLQRLAAGAVGAALTVEPVAGEELERSGRADLLAGEVELTERLADSVVRDDVAAWIGWMPAAELQQLNARLAPMGAAVAQLDSPRGLPPPTAVRSDGATGAFAPLVRTYATVPYADVDPTILAGLAYIVMFGAMFGDVGHGALLALGGLLARWGWRPFRRLRRYWLFLAGAGLSAMLFGLAYGECFGPTGWVPVGWLSPMEDPVRLLLGGVGLGAVLLAGAYTLGSINRVREGGWVYALYAPAGLAGAILFLAAGLGVAAWYFHIGPLGIAAGGVGLLGLGLTFAGLFSDSGGGAAGVLQAGVELMDLVLRLGANVVSFARLAAFGLTHAVLGWAVWTGTLALWDIGGAALVAAVALFVFGNALAFGLEALVAGIQALRLEYYELFSRVFQLEGRPFMPWWVPTVSGQR